MAGKLTGERKCMAKETEIKLAVSDAKAFERKLKKLGAKTIGEREWAGA